MKQVMAMLLAVAWAIAAEDTALVQRIWDGAQRAQKQYSSGCGRITETRTSKLLARPKVFRGKFCAEGLKRFSLEYTEPEIIRIRFDTDYLNVTTGNGKNMEVMDVGGNVRRTQEFFGKSNSIENLKKSFEITAGEEPSTYSLRLVPRSDNFRRRLNYVVVRLDKDRFLLKSLEVDGKSGVNSVFTIDISSVNTPPPPSTFEVYRPR